MFEIVDAQSQEAVIKVIGVGGCGGNAVDHMIAKGVQGVEFISANTDVQALKRNQAKMQLQLGVEHHQGPGRGRESRSRPAGRDRGPRPHRRGDRRRRHAVPDRRAWAAAPAPGRRRWWRRSPRSSASSRSAVVTKPFAFEGKRQRIAQEGIDALAQHVDSLIIVPNDKLMRGARQPGDARRGVPGGQRRAARRGRRHRRDHQLPGHDQRRFRRRAHRDGGDGHGDDGLGQGRGRRTARGSRRNRRSPARCSRTSTSRTRAACWSTSPRARRRSSCRRCTTSWTSIKAFAGRYRRPRSSARSTTTSLGDELRVTIVATGLGKTAAAPATEAAHRGRQQDRHRQPAGGSRLRRARDAGGDALQAQSRRDGRGDAAVGRGDARYPGVSAQAGGLKPRATDATGVDLT